MNIMKPTAAVVLFGVLGAVPLAGSATNGTDTCERNCGNIAVEHMRRTNTRTEERTETMTEEGGSTSTTTTKTSTVVPESPASAVYDAYGKCIAKCRD